MAEVYDVGDYALLTLAVSPADVDTEATVVVTAPDASTSSPTPTSNIEHSEWQLLLPLDAAGEWRIVWTVTGTGAGVQADTVYAVAEPAGLAYATPADYATHFRKAPPDNIRLLLLRASRAVDRLALCAVYAVDDGGAPTDTGVAAALREATVEQVDWWGRLGDDDGTGDTSALAGAQIGTVKLPGGADGGGVPEYAPAARAALARAGLLGTRPLVYGAPGTIPGFAFFASQAGA